MKTSAALFWLTTLTTAISASPLAKRASNSFAGANLYYLQGLSDADQDTYLKTLAADGAKVVRVWVKGQPQGKCEKGNLIAKGCNEFEDKIGTYNTYTLDILDSTLVKIAKNGMKAIISPHNANLLSDENGFTRDIYGQRWGSGDMYTKSDAAKAYDARLSAILNYKGAHSGKVWKNWHEAILGFDIENEPMLLDRKWEMNDPTGWICARSAHMRSVLGASNPIKIASGGVGGSYDNGANFANWVTSCPSLDIVSVHYYRNDGLDDQSFVSKGKGKLVMMEEWTTHQGSGQAGQYKAGAYAMNKIGLPWMLWQILPHQTCSTRDSDNSGLVINGGIDVKGPMTAAKNSKAAQDWTGIL